MTGGGSERCWDREDCPIDQCEGEIQQQDRFNVACPSCGAAWSHVRDETSHYLMTETGETVAEKPVKDRIRHDHSGREPEDTEAAEQVLKDALGEDYDV